MPPKPTHHSGRPGANKGPRGPRTMASLRKAGGVKAQAPKEQLTVSAFKNSRGQFVNANRNSNSNTKYYGQKLSEMDERDRNTYNRLMLRAHHEVNTTNLHDSFNSDGHYQHVKGSANPMARGMALVNKPKIFRRTLVQHIHLLDKDHFLKLVLEGKVRATKSGCQWTLDQILDAIQQLSMITGMAHIIQNHKGERIKVDEIACILINARTFLTAGSSGFNNPLWEFLEAWKRIATEQGTWEYDQTNTWYYPVTCKHGAELAKHNDHGGVEGKAFAGTKDSLQFNGSKRMNDIMQEVRRQRQHR